LTLGFCSIMAINHAIPGADFHLYVTSYFSPSPPPSRSGAAYCGLCGFSFMFLPLVLILFFLAFGF